jgi:hypothetical protein
MIFQKSDPNPQSWTSHFDASCQQFLGLESEILWKARSTPTLAQLKDELLKKASF